LGSAPDPAGGTYNAPLESIVGFKGPTFKGREGKGGRRGVPSTFLCGSTPMSIMMSNLHAGKINPARC